MCHKKQDMPLRDSQRPSEWYHVVPCSHCTGEGLEASQESNAGLWGGGSENSLHRFFSGFHSVNTSDNDRTTATKIDFSLCFEAKNPLKTALGGPFGVPVTI